jgi:hypothetical protein
MNSSAGWDFSTSRQPHVFGIKFLRLLLFITHLRLRETINNFSLSLPTPSPIVIKTYRSAPARSCIVILSMKINRRSFEFSMCSSGDKVHFLLSTFSKTFLQLFIASMLFQVLVFVGRNNKHTKTSAACGGLPKGWRRPPKRVSSYLSRSARERPPKTSWNNVVLLFFLHSN